MDNPKEVDDLITLYQRLYRHSLGAFPAFRSYGYAHKLLSELRGRYYHNQCRALIYEHFEWKGTSGTDEWTLGRLRNAGFPIPWLLNAAGMYAQSLREQVGEDIWGNDEALGKQVDNWDKMLLSSKTA